VCSSDLATTSSSGINFIWAYRGCQYRIVWQAAANGKLTAEVTDLVTGDLIPFHNIPLAPPKPESALGWCLYDSIGARFRIVTDTLSPHVTKSMIINGDVFDFNTFVDTLGIRHGTVMDDTLPAVGDTWIIYPLRFAPAPANAAYEVATNPLQFLATPQTLHVKVVPNPYLVMNEWERSLEFRKLKFINLPNDCTIRIYTMAGDLIRTIKHHETNVINGSVLNQQGGDEDWDLLSAAGQKPAPGMYIFHIESAVGEQVGKFAIVY
jgi:hypothetical protein